MMVCVYCGSPAGPGAPSHIAGIDCAGPKPEPVIALTIEQWRRLHQLWEETYQASMEKDFIYPREEISQMIHDRVRGIEEIIEGNGFALHHDTHNENGYRP